MPDPKSGDIGLVVNGNFLSASVPPSYIPSKGEQGIAATDGTVFLPIDTWYRFWDTNYSYWRDKLRGDDLLEFDQAIDREPPFYAQTDQRVATPCVSPYNWTVASADRTLILDTTPDALASAPEKALPGYVANPGLTISSRTHDDFDPSAYDDDDGVAYLWTYATTGSTPSQPHPALRAGQTRYSGISGAAVGTVFDGTAFLPSPLTNGTIRLSAYKHGLLLSADVSYTVKVKIGRGKATWNKLAQTLTLETTQTSGTTIKYTLNGGSLTTYTGPISITDTATVVWYAEKTNLVTSDSWSTYVEYQDEAPPDDFETIYFSNLPAFSNSPVKAVARFQQRPDWYISPSGTGDGLTPANPSNATTVIGLTTATGKAVGPRRLVTSKTGTADMQLAGDVTFPNPAGTVIKYSLDNSTWNTYSAPFAQTAPGRVWFRLERSDGSAMTPNWYRPWFIGSGTGVQINAVWSLSAQTLTLTYEPAPLRSVDVQILYSLDGSAPSLVYSGPISITTDCTPKVKAIHAVDAGIPSDFATSTGVYDCTTIDADATPDYDEDHLVTWAADATVASYSYDRGGDVIWCAEGTYSNPATTYSDYFSNATQIIVKGGYSSGFTERDVKNRKTIFACTTSASGVSDWALTVDIGILDGLWAETARFDSIEDSGGYIGAGRRLYYEYSFLGNLLRAGHIFNCHAVVSETFAGGSSESGEWIVGTEGYSYYEPAPMYMRYVCARKNAPWTPFVIVGTGGKTSHCTLSVDLEITDAQTGATANADGIGPDYMGFYLWGSAGADGGCNRMLVDIQGGYDCALDIRLVVGNAGAGGDAGAVVGGSGPYDRLLYSYGGYGGSSLLNVTLGALTGGVCNAVLQVGNSGNGGDGNTVQSMRTSGANPDRESAGGSCLGPAALTLTGAFSGASVAVNASVGNAGNGGNSNYIYKYDGTVISPSGSARSRPGSAFSYNAYEIKGAELSALSNALYGDFTGTFSSGDGGNGGTSPYPSNTYYHGSPSGTFCDVSFIVGNIRPVISADLSSGNGGTTDSTYPYYIPYKDQPTEAKLFVQTSSTVGVYYPTISGTTTCGTVGPTGSRRAYLSWTLTPVMFDSVPSITEGVPYGDGNPVRVDHAAGSTTGWYHGMDNGDGAPAALAGGAYYGPQGTGVQLGRYWE